jgi:hypothetical protein
VAVCLAAISSPGFNFVVGGVDGCEQLIVVAAGR